MTGQMDMKSYCSHRRIVFGLFIVSLIAASGCDFEFGDWGQARYERTVSRQAPLAANDALDVATQSGSISVTGADVTDCNIVAEIVARAPTEEEAQQLAEQVEIKAERIADTLNVRADRPKLPRNCSIGVSYTITAPRKVNVKCDSNYGSIRLANIEGTVKGKSSSGSMKAEGIAGPIDLSTSYGSITCTSIIGLSALRSSSGSITVADLKGSAKIETSYGSITCEEFSGDDLVLKTSSGKIAVSDASFLTGAAETSYGSVVGAGLKGNAIKLHSSSGSVTLTEALADVVDLHTSYGRVEARQITMAHLMADSGSGSVDIVCSPETPADLTAEVKSSYGSVDFTAPPGFSGQVHLSTGYGQIRTALPITLSGQISKKNVTGRIGEGNGTLRIETNSGSIELK